MRIRVKGIIAAGAIALGGCATQEPAKPGVNVSSSVQEGADRVERSNVVTVTAVVEKVDVAKRLVTLRAPDGKSNTIQVDEAVKNLPQLKKGDEVTVAYVESIALQVRKPGEAKVGEVVLSEGVETAKLGEKPGAVGARAVTIVTKVEAIDKANGTITLKGPEGEVRTVKAQNPANLDKVKVGELIEITYTEAVAISVAKP